MLTTLLILIMGIFVIIAAARYYEDDKLFWKLCIPFLGAYAIGSFMFNMNNEPSVESSEQDHITQVCSMQSLITTHTLIAEYLADVSNSTTVSVPTLVAAGLNIAPEKCVDLANLEVFNLGNFIWKEPPIYSVAFTNTS